MGQGMVGWIASDPDSLDTRQVNVCFLLLWILDGVWGQSWDNLGWNWKSGQRMSYYY